MRIPSIELKLVIDKCAKKNMQIENTDRVAIADY